MTTDTINALQARRDEMQIEAMAEGRRLIREKLRELEARFPRHRFRFLDGMGTMSVECSPAIFGEHPRATFTNLDYIGRDDPAQTGLGLEDQLRGELCRARDAIHEIACRIGDEFKVDFGEVTTSADEEGDAADLTPAEKMTAAIEALGLSIRCEFVPFSQSRSKGADMPSLNWLVTVERSGREVMTTDYMQGSGHSPAYKAKGVFPHGAPSDRRAKGLQERAIAAECETGRIHQFGEGFAMSRDGIRDMRKPIEPPAAHEVIWSLSRDADVLEFGTFEDWADEFGYDADSRKGEAIYRACLEIALKLRGAIGEAGIDALRTAGEDY